MEYTLLGSTGVTVSRLCFGTMSFGGDADEATSAAMFARCRDAGVNFFDCANVYSQGKAEEILGKLIKPCRDELVITSKVGFGFGGGSNNRGLSRRNIMMMAEGSLSRLGTDRLDVYFCHTFDHSTPMDESLRAMDDLVRQGKVLYVGASNWPAWQVMRAQGICRQSTLAPISVLQPMYSLAKRTAEIEILPMAKSLGLGVIPYSPLGGGLLTGKYLDREGVAGRFATNKMYIERYKRQTYHDIARNFSDYAKKAGVHPATLAVAWAKANPAVTAPIIGARNLQQLEASLAAGDYKMSPEQYRDISELTPPVPVATDRDEEKSE